MPSKSLCLINSKPSRVVGTSYGSCKKEPKKMPRPEFPEEFLAGHYQQSPKKILGPTKNVSRQQFHRHFSVMRRPDASSVPRECLRALSRGAVGPDVRCFVIGRCEHFASIGTEHNRHDLTLVPRERLRALSRGAVPDLRCLVSGSCEY